MFHIDECGHAPQFLRFSNDMLCDSRLAGRLGAVNLGHSPPRNAANSQRNIQRQGACGYGLDFQTGGLPQTHDGAIAIALSQVQQRSL